ncbi:MAG TPA: alpha/beta fold hydrolase, partial [Candidatus Binatia bacterium]|nr:alpha/beta fold hydrolase [Candidatus Binatia bacterium]
DALEPPYSMDDLSDDLVGLLDKLDIQNVLLCGLSVGGLIAQRFVLKHPDRVRGLVLCDTGARIGTVESWNQRIEIVRSGGVESFVAPSMERWFSAAFRRQRAAEVRGYANMLRQISVKGYLGVCAALRDADLTQAVRAITKPTLVLCGDQDIATPPEMGRALADAIPGAKFSLIPDAAHLSCIEQPERMAKMLIEFFGSSAFAVKRGSEIAPPRRGGR